MSQADADQALEALLSRLHDGVTRRDIETVVGCFHPAARVPDSLEGGFASGLDEIRAYYLHQFATVQVDASLLAVLHHEAGIADTLVQAMIRGADGGFWWEGQVRAVYHLSEGLIVAIEINDNPDKA